MEIINICDSAALQCDMNVILLVYCVYGYIANTSLIQVLHLYQCVGSCSIMPF